MLVEQLGAQEMPWRPGQLVVAVEGVVLESEIAESVGEVEPEPIGIGSVHQHGFQDGRAEADLDALMDRLVGVLDDAEVGNAERERALQLVIDIHAIERQVP